LSRPVIGGITLLAVLLAWFWSGPLDRWVFDRQAAFLARKALASPVPLVLVAIDEASVEAAPEPIALWHRHWGALLEALAQGRPRAVALDLTLPAHSYDAVSPGGDAALMRGLFKVRQTCPLVVGVTVQQDGQPRPIHAPFRAIVGMEGLGLVLWEVDPDRKIRRFSEHFNGQAEPVPTLAGQVARQLGVRVEDGWLDYRVGGPVPTLSLAQVEAWGREGRQAELLRAFGGKVVLVGTTQPFLDRHWQAVDLNGWGEVNGGYAPGVLLHAQALRGLLGGGLLRAPSPLGRMCLVLLMALLGVTCGRGTRWGALAALALLGLLLGSSLFAQSRGLWLHPGAPALALGLGYGILYGGEAFLKLRERRRLRSMFDGYVSPAILDEILAGRMTADLEGRRTNLCVLFSDVRGFTTLSEGREPEAIIAVLNRYFDRMAPCIHAAGGSIDKYLGDGIMAHFGHPQPLANPSQAAFQAAVQMLEALKVFNAELAMEGLPPLGIGIGLHFGPVVVGHIGSHDRHEYTAIGDTVNVASRVEGLTKDVGYPLLMTEAVRLAVGPMALDPCGDRSLKGHSAMAVFGWPPKHPSPKDTP
jgi:class 3 adenylate cyclase